MMNPNTSNSDLAKSVQIAEFRFALIAPVIQGLFPDASRAEYYRRITEKPFTLPDGSIVKYKPKTIEKWASNYHRMGFDGLLPKERSDKGSTRVLPDVAIERIYQLKKDYPRLKYVIVEQKRRARIRVKIPNTDVGVYIDAWWGSYEEKLPPQIESLKLLLDAHRKSCLKNFFVHH